MSDILNTYPVFERNQVLTSTQLNNLVNYLDQQNRLTRARLIGMGVVCGLEIDYNKSKNTITISKGTGITSEGYLIALGECVTVKYRPYNLPPGTIYEPFVDGNNKQDISLYELLTDSAKVGADDKLLDDETFLADKIVLLFIESFDKDLKSCLGKSCDELGKERILTLRKLLISKADLLKVWNRTNTGKLDAVFPEKFKLPVVNMQRVLFNPSLSHAKDYNDFSLNYTKAILEVFDKLVAALTETYDIYRPLLLESYNEKNPFTASPVTNRLAKLHNFLNNAEVTLKPYIGVQYVYDLFQDLILAYREFKNTAFDLMSECCPDMSRFPKHLMLGEAISPTLTLCKNSEYRHYFIQPPIYNLQKLLIQRTIALHNRLVLMLESFDLKRINGFKGVDGKSFPVRITPSLEKTTSLSLRSIPWYYDLKKKSSYSALGLLKNYWNFDISRKCADEKEGLILNYDDQINDQSLAKNKLNTPLFYDIQEYSFLRIEGQIGVDVNLAINQINNLKTQFDLPFNTIALQLDPNLGSLSLDYNCGFHDIQEEYKILKLSFCRFADDIRELYLFVDENQETLFNDNKEENDTSKFLEKIKEFVELLAAICNSMQECFKDFDFIDFQKRYKNLLERSIEIILVDFELLSKINISKEDAEKEIPLINGLIQRLSPLANKFIDMLFYNRFLRLYYSFKRREFYLKKQIDVFSTYIRKNPGIDHQAGVPKGGTFILVYINDAKNEVIADFSLPYLCCTKSNCIPMCDEEGGFVWEMDPFARPDYAITLVDISVEIDVLRNDSPMLGGAFVIKSDETSTFGGTIEQKSETGTVTYAPKKGFTGTDTFNYTLFDKKTGKSDLGTVTIVVKEPEQTQGCYTVEILECWGEKSVRKTLNVRDINIPEGANVFELLLESLRKTAGFTEDEIFSNVLEDPERRRALLNCIGIQNDDNTTYEQLGQLIFDYQRSNCGSVQPTSECYTVAILQCWGDEAVKETLNHRDLGVPTGSNMFEALLADLRKTGGFTENEVFFNVLESLDRRRKLLNCLGIPNDDTTTYEQLGQLILDFQKKKLWSSSTGKGMLFGGNFTLLGR